MTWPWFCFNQARSQACGRGKSGPFLQRQYCHNSFLSLSSLAGANPLSLSSHLHWAGSGQSVADLDLRGESNAKVRERGVFNLKTGEKVAWPYANVPGMWILSGSVQVCAFWMPCAQRRFTVLGEEIDFWICFIRHNHSGFAVWIAK